MFDAARTGVGISEGIRWLIQVDVDKNSIGEGIGTKEYTSKVMCLLRGSHRREPPRTDSAGQPTTNPAFAVVSGSPPDSPRHAQTPCPCLGVKGGVEPVDLPRFSRAGNQNTSREGQRRGNTSDGVPATCPTGRPDTGSHGHSWTSAMTITCASAGLARPITAS